MKEIEVCEHIKSFIKKLSELEKSMGVSITSPAILYKCYKCRIEYLIDGEKMAKKENEVQDDTRSFGI